MTKIEADMGANVWKVLVGVGDRVSDGDTLLILESMKMEIPVICEDDGTVAGIHVSEGDTVEPGQVLVELNEE